MNDLARSFVIDRDISYVEILGEVPREDRIQIMNIMLGISTAETGPLENKEKQIKGRIKKLEADIEAVKGFLKEVDVPTIETIVGFERENKSRKDKLIAEEVDIRRQIMNKTKKREKSTYDEIRTEILRKRETLRDKESELSTLRYQERHKFRL